MDARDNARLHAGTLTDRGELAEALAGQVGDGDDGLIDLVRLDQLWEILATT